MATLVEEEMVFVLKELPGGNSNIGHLNELLSHDWYVKSACPMGMSGSSQPSSTGMAVIVLRKPKI